MARLGETGEGEGREGDQYRGLATSPWLAVSPCLARSPYAARSPWLATRPRLIVSPRLIMNPRLIVSPRLVVTARLIVSPRLAFEDLVVPGARGRTRRGVRPAERIARRLPGV